MKNYLKKISAVGFVLISMAFFMSGCVEHRYYRTNHHHSPDYYHRHPHRTPPPGVDINIHN